MNEPFQFEASQWAYLTSHFGLKGYSAVEGDALLRADRLLAEGACADYLDQLSRQQQSPSTLVTASLFIKRYAYLTAVPAFYAMSVYDAGINIAADNCYVKTNATGAALEGIALASLALERSAETERSLWRQRIVEKVFAEHLGAIVQVVSRTAKVPRAVLWENIAVRVCSLYEKRIEQQEGTAGRQRSRDDFHYIMCSAPGALFGERNNPLTRFFSPLPMANDGKPTVRMRHTCCFHYKVAKDAAYCDNCPKGAR
ncbi:hypothetical protein EBB07_23195 [Paenibacillaceae bacterium]|nr:hypothetical protein EBB07_23195 [Paenibacillaceae bacterium]